MAFHVCCSRWEKWPHRLLIGDERKIGRDCRRGFSLALNT